MKKLSLPPFIIFLDLLFMFLFIFILTEKKVIQIKTIGNKIPKGTEIVYYDKYFKGYYTLNNHIYAKDRKYTYYGECDNNIVKCQRVKEKYGKKVFIAYPKEIQDEIANFGLITLGTSICSKMIFVIKEDGNLDYRKMVEENPCIKKVSHYEKLFSES